MPPDARCLSTVYLPNWSGRAEESALDELQALASQLDDRERHAAHALEDALRRMRSDDFGVCIDCGREIPFERLRAVPWTLRCAEDQARAEKNAHPPSL